MVRERQRNGLAWLLAALSAATHGCNCDAPAAAAKAAHVQRLRVPGTTNAPAEEASRYPPGAWRKAAGEDLDHTVLWLSHILIRHNEVSDFQVSFTLVNWRSSQQRVNRSRRDAFALAERLVRTAREQGNFDNLARQYSEESETRERGGSIGGVIARHLTAWPSILDAISALEPGEVSEVVESDYGYHIFQRRSPVPEALVSGSHIVIAHADAPWIRMVARGPIQARSREDAWTLATRLYEDAKQKPADFPKLVSEYSEHRDAARGGDFGTWSTREPTGYPREVETLAQLEVGGIAAPIDTVFGIQVIQRTPNRPRQHYAMTAIQLRFDSDLDDADPASKHAILGKAQAMASTLQRDANQFVALQKEFCCTAIWDVIEGREVPALEATLAGLAANQIAEQPVEDVAVQYMIPKRLDLDVLPKVPATRFELPVAADPPAGG